MDNREKLISVWNTGEDGGILLPGDVSEELDAMQSEAKAAMEAADEITATMLMESFDAVPLSLCKAWAWGICAN